MIFALLADAAIRALLLGAATWLVLRVLRVDNPHLEKIVWRTVLVAALALPALLYWRIAPALAVTLPIPAFAAADAGGAAASGISVSGFTTLLPALATVYVGVSALLLARFLVGLARTWRICRAAEPLPAGEQRLSAQINSPATFGSIILLPDAARGWSASELDAVLTHERAHVRWRDCHWLWLAQAHLIVFWFNPLAWWLRRRLQVLSEATSDDAVLAANHDHLAYAKLLLDFARNPNRGRVAMSIAGPKVSARIERILSRKPPAIPPHRAARLLAVAVLIPAVLIAAASAGAPVAATEYQTVDNDDPAGPRIVDYGDLVKLGDRYPPLARQHRVTGDVMLGATIDAEGRVLEVVVLDEQPADPRYGFGAAALEIARTVRFANPRSETMRVKFRVKFKLDN